MFDGKLPTMWVDNMRFSLRSDGLGVLSFFQSIPSSETDRVEVVRIITNANHLRQISDVLAQILKDHAHLFQANGREA